MQDMGHNTCTTHAIDGTQIAIRVNHPRTHVMDAEVGGGGDAALWQQRGVSMCKAARACSHTHTHTHTHHTHTHTHTYT